MCCYYYYYYIHVCVCVCVCYIVSVPGECHGGTRGPAAVFVGPARATRPDALNYYNSTVHVPFSDIRS